MRPGFLVLPLVTLLGCLVPTGFGTGTGSSRDSGTTDGVVEPRPVPVPTTVDGMLSFLAKGSYASYPTTSAVTRPQGPHGVAGVRAYYHPSLLASLDDQAVEHPAGAGAVLELYSADGTTRFGWAASVKVDPTSDGGFGWLWLEAVEAPDGPKLVEGGDGLSLCINCHASGDDYVIGVKP
ncbi:MAG: hypothetical protein FJ096_07665 [Deltaproteobacteria bacterium]|nr:hypothetical protein [Deltaproteobacteria bacterium]